MDELVQQTREVLAGEPVTTNIFPFQVCRRKKHLNKYPNVFHQCQELSEPQDPESWVNYA